MGNMTTFRDKLYSGGTTLALVVCELLPVSPARAPEQYRDEEVVVTGTSIRGVQPVGANLISVGRVDIDNTAAQTVQDILKQVPTLSNLGQTAQGNFTPAIHNLGAVSRYSTLVLIDGHRFAYGGATTVLRTRASCRPTLLSASRCGGPPPRRSTVPTPSPASSIS